MEKAVPPLNEAPCHMPYDDEGEGGHYPPVVLRTMARRLEGSPPHPPPFHLLDNREGPAPLIGPFPPPLHLMVSLNPLCPLR